MPGFYPWSLWTCSAHYFSHTNNAHINLINRTTFIRTTLVPSLLLMSQTWVLVTVTLSAAPGLSNCQNQNPKDIRTFPWDLLNILMAVHEMGKYIAGMNNEKSSRPDEISSRLFNLALRILQDHWPIFLICASSTVFSPQNFKKRKLFLYPKLEITKHLYDYRPTSLLSVLSKLLERHVHQHLVTYLETRDLFHPLQ